MSNLSRLIARLTRGQEWLTNQHQLWLKGGGMDDYQFSRGLVGWDGLERLIRCSGYLGCVSGQARCPAGSPVICDACVQAQAVKL